jgi:hypothetical protein
VNAAIHAFGGPGFGAADLCLAIYVAGVVWGLMVIDARPAARIALALAWPLGPIAFAVTITVLLGASLIAFPAFGIAVLIAAGAAWLFVQ